jgi:arylsulfatase A-like enzyme
MRWPGVIKPGTEINEITSHEDFVPTLVAAVGEANVKEKLPLARRAGFPECSMPSARPPRA